jgi:hypothetical protein
VSDDRSAFIVPPSRFRTDEAAPPTRDHVTVVPPKLTSPTPLPAMAADEVVIPAAFDDDSERTSLRSRSGGMWRLELPDGSRITVIRPLILGRGPAADPRWPDAELYPVSDPEQSVSKSHAVFDVVDGAIRVTDLGSTNGLAVVAADGTERVGAAHERLVLLDGDTVELGSFAVRIDRSMGVPE